MAKTIELTRGMSAIVDDEDYEWINKWKWQCSTRGYAIRNTNVIDAGGKKKTVSIHMHRIIAETPQGKITDHINGNQLDNRRCNLRVCSSSQNQANKNAISGNYKGVTWWKKGDGWEANICHEGDQMCLGYYKSEIDAAIAYDKAATRLFGEYARLNFPGIDFSSYMPKRIKRDGSSKYRGVYWHRRAEKWCSSISIKGKRYTLGMFASEEEAALAYNEAVCRAYPKSAEFRINQIEERL